MSSNDAIARLDAAVSALGDVDVSGWDDAALAITSTSCRGPCAASTRSSAGSPTGSDPAASASPSRSPPDSAPLPPAPVTRRTPSPRGRAGSAEALSVPGCPRPVVCVPGRAGRATGPD